MLKVLSLLLLLAEVVRPEFCDDITKIKLFHEVK
jgi:hypothetical protein